MISQGVYTVAVSVGGLCRVQGFKDTSPILPIPLVLQIRLKAWRCCFSTVNPLQVEHSLAGVTVCLFAHQLESLVVSVSASSGECQTF